MGLTKGTWRVAVVVLLTAAGCSCYEKGAPLSRCGSMMPKHKSLSPQESIPDYALTVEEDDRKVTVIIEGKNGQTFRGLMLEARATPEKTEALGKFVDLPHGYSALNCNEKSNSAVTHNMAEDRNKLEFDWEAPYDYEGDIVFVATVVANFTTFWTGVKSPVIKVTKRSPPDNGPTSIPSFEQEIYGGCGVDKVCLGSSEDCISEKSCTAIVTVKNIGINYEFEMISKAPSKYVAYGISEDDKMGADSVIECVMKDDGTMEAHRSWNLPNAKQNRRLDDQTGFTVKSLKYEDHTIYCKIHQEAVLNIEDTIFNLDKNSYYLLLAAGSSLKDGIGFHDLVYKVTPESRKLSNVGPVKEHDDFYNDCNVLKNCFGYPQNCNSKQNCEAIVSVIAQGNKYHFEMKAKSASYVAVGLSEDDKMGGDSVVECVNEGNGIVKAYMSWNIPGQKANTRKSLNQANINLINASIIDGDVYCKFSREVKTTVEQKTFDLEKDKYYLLLASGSKSVNSNGIGFHDLVYVASGEKRLLSDVGTFVVGSKLLLRLHGAFMVAAWIGAASIGIVLARYYKQTWVGGSLCAKDLWFAWHRFFMVLTWCLTLVGFALIFIEIGGWVNYRSQNHAILGCVTTILCFIQPIGAAFRPHPTARNRPIFNWLHWFIGNSAHIFSIITIFFAVPIKKVELPEWLDWILVAYVAFYVLMHIILSFSAFISDRSNGKRVNSFPMKDISARTPLNSTERKQDAPHSGFRKFMLSLHILGVLILCIAIILIIVLAPIEVQWSNLKNKVTSL